MDIETKTLNIEVLNDNEEQGGSGETTTPTTSSHLGIKELRRLCSIHHIQKFETMIHIADYSRVNNLDIDKVCVLVKNVASKNGISMHEAIEYIKYVDNVD